MVAISRAVGDQRRAHPHVHALVTRGGWTACGEWVGLPYVDHSAAEQLFSEARVYSFSQKVSYVSKEFAAGDPAFWTPAPAAAAEAPRPAKKK